MNGRSPEAVAPPGGVALLGAVVAAVALLAAAPQAAARPVPEAAAAPPSGWVEALVKARPAKFRRMLEDTRGLRAQVVVGVVFRDASGALRLSQDAWPPGTPVAAPAPGSGPTPAEAGGEGPGGPAGLVGAGRPPNAGARPSDTAVGAPGAAGGASGAAGGASGAAGGASGAAPGGRPSAPSPRGVYFYPASAIKLCAAVAALAALRVRAADNPHLHRDTPLTWLPLFPGERRAAADPTAPDGRITLAWEIRKALVVSDNGAFNRLFEFAGHRDANERLWRAGLPSVRLWHRLNIVRSAEDNRRSPGIELALPGHRGKVALPPRTSDLVLPPLDLDGLDVGSAYLAAEGGARVEAPMSFRDKNHASLADLQRLLAAVVRPEVDAGVDAHALGLAEADRRFLREVLGEDPARLNPQIWHGGDYREQGNRPSLPGVLRVRPREALEVRGKAGRAYGFHVENAYYRDRKTGRAFFLAAAIHVNSDGVLNDGRYEYDSISVPFMADLGEAVARAVFAPPRREPAPVHRPALAAPH